ncbi:chemotaxis protein CheA [Pyxidicoccus fallax]|uniref:Chemotaxis protein CheA n=1 Tax=Pyxidicoccus fallax TaxID=394095 RepID=A0A848L881_9BACT|nr:chemotaxis protein CheA [Pyxidicoccus fallax]NMO14452.1 chemotaxis protein CheA [Pyxidicoccus fallax]NPC80828.1 chemotaxis protein CheA [Pyxidicoccus fallax]
MTMDMSRYLGLFISEATDHLEALGRDLVQLEREGTATVVDSMFRHAHSVKGMASSMGFEPIAVLAHRVEDLVDAVRQDRGRLDRDVVDLLLTAADTMLAQVRAVAESKPADEASVLLTQLGNRYIAMTGKGLATTRVAKTTMSKPAATDGASTGTASGDGPARPAGDTAVEGPAGTTKPGTESTAQAGGGAASTSEAAGAQASGDTGSVAEKVAKGTGAGTPSGTSRSQSPVGIAGPTVDLAAQGLPLPPDLLTPPGTSPNVVSASGVPSVGAAEGAVAVVAAALGLVEPPPNDLVDRLKDAASVPVPAQTPPPAEVRSVLPPRVPAEARGPMQRWAVRLRIAPTCQVPGVRAFLVHKRLTNLGTLVDLRPALEELKAGRIPDGYIQLELETTAGDTGIHASLKNVVDVEVVSVKPAVAAPAPVVAAPAAEAARAANDATARTVRVRTELLDYFLDTVGELMLATARLREVGKVLPENARPALEEGVYRLHTLVKDLHDKVMTARMTPLSLITDRLPRAARDIARRKEREVDLVITGAEIELDRAILDELADPLMHLLRNCIDHGLESPEERVAAKKGPRGRVLVAVKRARDRVIIEIEDDGRGMDPAKLKSAAVARGLLSVENAARMSDREAFLLSCLPGVSTAKDITDISGRGVGMDAVKRVVENVGGTLEIDSEKGRGTRFTLRLPLTVAVVHLLLVEVGDEVFGLPIAKVVGATEADGEALSRSRETALLPHGNSLLPVHSLDTLVGVPAPPRQGARPFVVMDADSGRVALAVDRLLGQEEVVLKPLSRPLDLLPGLSGVTILGSGRPVFILDVPRLLSA